MRVTLEMTAENSGPQPAGGLCPQIGIPGGSFCGFPWEGGRPWGPQLCQELLQLL